MSAMTVTAVVETEPWAGLAAFLRGDLSWQDRALCAETDPEEFFQDKGGSTAKAKRICQACEVRVECLEYALVMEKGSPWGGYGVWGGLSARERQAVARARKPQAAAILAGLGKADGLTAPTPAREPGRAAPRPEHPQARALDNIPDKRAPDIESPQAGDTGRPDKPADNGRTAVPSPGANEPARIENAAEPEPVLTVPAAPVSAPARRHRKCGYPLGSIGHKIACGDTS